MLRLLALDKNTGETLILVESVRNGTREFSRIGQLSADQILVNAAALVVTRENSPDWMVDLWTWSDSEIAADSFVNASLPSLPTAVDEAYGEL